MTSTVKQIATLTDQLDAAKAIVASFEAAFGEGKQYPNGVESVGEAWNAAHDMVSALENEIENVERTARRSKLDPARAALVAANMD